MNFYAFIKLQENISFYILAHGFYNDLIKPLKCEYLFDNDNILSLLTP